MIKIVNPRSGESKELENCEISCFECFKNFDRQSLKKCVAARINGRIVDLSSSAGEDSVVEMVFADEPDGLAVIRHSASHVMAAAVTKLFPEVKVAIGPSIENGFYYDFDKEEAFVPEDLDKIEREMRKIIAQNFPFKKTMIKKEEAIKLFEEKGEKYKAELAGNIDAEEVSIYSCGDFSDLCAGPHIPSTAGIKEFKLLSIAGAYWRGDENREMLQRIYGTAFDDKKSLNEYIARLEEAKKRDHRKLGKELDLFGFYENGGPGLVYWHPNGAFIRKTIEDFWKNEHLKRGYELVYTPHIARIDLWKKSGHWDFYNENMYRPIDIDGQQYILKPMNCPFHIMIYNSRPRSYKELPVRFAELGTVYRYERSGALHGLLRVRGFTQDDAHIFCSHEQLEEEMMNCVNFAIFLMETFGFKEYEINLATRPEKYAGTSEDWDRAESTLAKALEAAGLPYVLDEGGAVFYGPKIDIKIKDALGRSWQGPTVQFDFNLPGRFDVKYKGADGKEHLVYMVHRALLGSMERFMGCLTEHYGGAFPLWLCPVQAVVTPITEKYNDYARSVRDALAAGGARVKLDDRNEKINAKIKRAQLEKIPYMVVVGEQESSSGTVSVRHRKAGNIGTMPLEVFISKIKAEILDKI